jgi:hypothetical protein
MIWRLASSCWFSFMDTFRPMAISAPDPFQLSEEGRPREGNAGGGN